jgi:periplasmic divalent cation tolerance protein
VEPIASVQITCPAGSADWLHDFARALVADRLASSVNIVPGVRSLYRWQGEVHDAAELVAIVNTRAALVEDIIARTNQEHPYVTPGIRWHPIEAPPDYWQWVIDSTSDTP